MNNMKYKFIFVLTVTLVYKDVVVKVIWSQNFVFLSQQNILPTGRSREEMEHR